MDVLTPKNVSLMNEIKTNPIYPPYVYVQHWRTADAFIFLIVKRHPYCDRRVSCVSVPSNRCIGTVAVVRETYTISAFLIVVKLYTLLFNDAGRFSSCTQQPSFCIRALNSFYWFLNALPAAINSLIGIDQRRWRTINIAVASASGRSRRDSNHDLCHKYPY